MFTFAVMTDFSIIQKYNVPIPRYTSYPTVPYWQDNKSSNEEWKACMLKAINDGRTKNGISIYIHLPFCEQLCTYCGCNKRITKNHSVEGVYLEAVLKEWEMYKAVLGIDFTIKEIHLGGGTPTFFSPENLKLLIQNITKDIRIAPDHEFSFEGHPNNTTYAHLKTLFEVGFNRVSFGVQDLNEKVQVAINRVQPFEKTKQVTEWAREIGYTSVNFDLIYGLPFQTLDSIKNTITRVIELKPDRLAFYSYAHVPWTKKSQRAYDENDLPKGKDKFALYTAGKELFLAAGYEDVGMDHFALKDDGLLQCKREGKLHRNFMGYTTNNTEILIGLGVSAISDVYYGYRQNYKTVEEYYEAVNKEDLPIQRGVDLTDEDVLYRQQILNISCKGKTKWDESVVITDSGMEKLNDLQADGILQWQPGELKLTLMGWGFLRNVCAVFDKRMNDDLKKQDAPKFSQAI